MPDDPRADFAPVWLTCTECRGAVFSGFTRCLAHLGTDLERYLDRIEPGAVVDVRGTTISGELLDRLLAAVSDAPGHPVLGFARFDHVWFTGDARFQNVAFTHDVTFTHAQFDGYALFDGASFGQDAGFDQARFGRPALFRDAVSEGELHFVNARFEKRAWLGPLRTTDLRLDRARFEATAEVAVEAEIVRCQLTRFEGGANLRCCGSFVDAAQTTFGAASTIVGSEGVHILSDTPRGNWMPQLVSLQATDVSNLELADVDLRWCEFSGAHRLDQLRFAGRCPFNTPPRSWRWTQRQTLAEEYPWRGWDAGTRRDLNRLSPERLAALYRSLRKALEDSKNEAGAGDFYYGEMDARRHSSTTRWAERRILGLYWLLSGYGQRGGRALVALLVLIATVTVLLLTWGQPFGSAARLAVGAVVFRDDGTDLTEAGAWTVLVARFLGPVLLALAVLAVRARVKR